MKMLSSQKLFSLLDAKQLFLYLDSKKLFSLLSDKKLFEAFNEKYQEHYGDATFWRELHALDKEIVKGGIYKENFHASSENPSSSDHFDENQETLVIQFKNLKAAQQGASLLTRILKKTPTRFLVEKIVHDGHETYQIRSDIDKAQWARLALFCIYRFDQEIKDQQEQKFLMQECKDTIEAYLGGTNKAWNADTGMPAFCTLMGMNGILRPENPEPPDVNRHFRELNPDEESLRPLFMREIIVHVDFNRDGLKTGHPYREGLDRYREAMASTVEGGNPNLPTWLGFIDGVLKVGLEVTGLNGVLGKSPIANRVARWGVAGVSAWAVVMEGRSEPFAIIGVAVVGQLIGFAHNGWRILGSSRQLHKHSVPLVLCKNETTGHVTETTGGIIKTTDFKVTVEEAFSPENLSQLEGLIKQSSAGPEVKDITILQPKPRTKNKPTHRHPVFIL